MKHLKNNIMRGFDNRKQPQLLLLHVRAGDTEDRAVCRTERKSGTPEDMQYAYFTVVSTFNASLGQLV